jgi:hypothetical protein
VDALSKADSPMTSEKAKLVGTNYLIRYLYLLAFDSFLYEIFGKGKVLAEDINLSKAGDFARWMKERPEIINLLRHVTLE